MFVDSVGVDIIENYDNKNILSQLIFINKIIDHARPWFRGIMAISSGAYAKRF